MPLPRKQLRQLGEVDLQPARLVPREQIGSRAPAGLLLIVEIAELLSVLVADDEAGVYSSRRWSRAAGSGGGMSRLLRPVVKPRNLVCRIDRAADQLDGRSCLLLRGQSLPSQHGLLQRGAIGLSASTVVQRGGALRLAISVARNPCRNAIKISVASP